MRILNVAICGLACLFGQTLLAQDNCGPGKVTFRAPPALNKACGTHDKAYASVQGRGKYMPGLGNKAVQQADRQLIRDALSSVPTAPRRSLTVAGYFTAKTMGDAVGNVVRAGGSGVRALAQSTLKKLPIAR